MSNPPDMSTPVTRGELHEALEIWGGAIIAKVEAMLERIRAEAAASEQRIRAAAAASEQRILAELGRHTTAGEESLRGDVSAIDDRYKDLRRA